MQFVDPPHQGQIVGAGDRPGPIDARTRQIQQRTLPRTDKFSACRSPSPALGMLIARPPGQEIPFNRQLANLV